MYSYLGHKLDWQTKRRDRDAQLASKVWCDLHTLVSGAHFERERGANVWYFSPLDGHPDAIYDSVGGYLS